MIDAGFKGGHADGEGGDVLLVPRLDDIRPVGDDGEPLRDADGRAAASGPPWGLQEREGAVCCPLIDGPGRLSGGDDDEGLRGVLAIGGKEPEVRHGGDGGGGA